MERVKNKIMRALIIGGSSLLGKYLVQTNESDEIEKTWFTNHIYGGSHLDICSPSQVNYTFARVNPDVVIHCAAIGSVDYAESHFTETHMVNAIGTRNIVTACRDFKSKIIYISTNAVFDGKNPPYSENSERNPINGYGIIKREAESTVLASGIDWMIIRPFLLYGWPYLGGRQNWVTTILDRLSKGQEIHLVDDTYWQPTLVEDCALTIWKLIKLDKWSEIYHVASDDRMTLFEFGLKIARIFEKDLSLIQPIASSSLQIAPRPKDTTFDLSKIHNLGIQLRGVEEGLKVLKDERLGISQE